MIRVERQKAPAFMRSQEFRSLHDEFNEFSFGGGTGKHQRRFPIRKMLEQFRMEIDEALRLQFNNKCAYTEVGEDLSQPDYAQMSKQSAIERSDPLQHIWHRPTGDATAPDGTVSAEHYWWLTLVWENWYLGSVQVESIKHSQFPVVGKRTRIPTRTSRPKLDRGVLLDPCRDWPSFWLRFDEDGDVEPRNHPSQDEWKTYAGTDRGEAAIRILQLNNNRLVESRRTAIAEAQSRLPTADDVNAARLDWLTDPMPHQGAIAQIVSRWVMRNAGDIDRPNLRRHVATFMDVAPDAAAAELWDAADVRLDAKTLRSLRPLADFVHGQFIDVEATERYAVLSGESRPAAVTAATEPQEPATPSQPQPQVIIEPSDRITSVFVKNFRAIKAAEITIDGNMLMLHKRYGTDDPDELFATRWKMLLGENGSGKSSFLQAIALALAAGQRDQVLEEAGLEWSDLLRRGNGLDKPRRGQIKLTFTSGQIIDLRFSASKSWYQGLAGGTPEIFTGVRAYGATRLLGKGNGDDPSPATPTHAQPTATTVGTTVVTNLFDPSFTVMDAKSWLCRLGPEPFNIASITLAELLGLPSSPDEKRRAKSTPRIWRNDDRTEIRVDGDRLEDVSDGYRSVIAVACDIMAGIGGLHITDGGFGDLANARGIVLIDEIGAHLHPRWRMEITQKLRRALPNVQFIVTTHEPLCLRGLQEREVVRVVKYQEYGVVVDEIDKAPARYRVDQLLTSEFFGLDSAIDPEVDNRFERYYALQRKLHPTDEELAELADLDRELNQRLRPILGYTRRDQLIYEIIDGFLMDRAVIDPKERQERRKKTIEDVHQIWSSLSKTNLGTAP